VATDRIHREALSENAHPLPASGEVAVWDVFVRFAHWTLALAFFVAYLTEDEVLTVHVWAGYLVGVLVAVRIAWGFIGLQHARFDDFIYRPIIVLGYLRDLLLARAKRYMGHSPAGGAMVIALLMFLAATTVTGLIVYAEEEGRGPLAALYTQGITSTTPQAQGEVAEDGEQGEEREGESASLEEVHEVIANITLALVVLHILGVILASFVHHENLVRAMITGRKRAEQASIHEKNR
jgi:cytochrome b